MNLKNKALKAYMGCIRNICSDNTKLRMKLFDCMVKPIMNYGSEVWSSFYWPNINDTNLYKQCETLETEKLHLKFIKGLLGVNRLSCNAAVRGEVGAFPMLIQHIKSIIRYLFRMEKISPDSLLYKSYMECKEMMSINQNCWLTGVQQILSKVGIVDSFSGNVNIFCANDLSVSNIMKSVLKSIHNTYREQWYSVINKIDEHNKLRTYNTFKKEFSLESYVVSLTSRKQCSEFAKLRISAHKLQIELGRYNRPNIIPINKRYCPHCRNGDIEDEIHFVIDCSLYADERNILFDEIKNIVPNFGNMTKSEKFIFMMNYNNGDTEILRFIAKYISRCMDTRSSNTV